jgi:hypothetical protein
MDRHAAEWGLASLFLGGVLCVMALVAMLLNLFVGSLARNIMSPGDARLALNAAFIVLGAVFLLTLFSIGAAVKGVFSAQNRQHPAALPLAGLFLSFLALIVWIIAAFEIIGILTALARHVPVPAV